MVLVKAVTSSTPSPPIPDAIQGANEKNLLDLTPGDIVFYVGGYPSNFTVSSERIGTEIISVGFFYVLLRPFAFLLLYSRRRPSTTPCTRAALSSPLLTTKSSVFITSKTPRRSIRRLRARGMMAMIERNSVSSKPCFSSHPSFWCQVVIFQPSCPVFFFFSCRYVGPKDSEYYEGTGYSKVIIDTQSTYLLISMSVTSRSENGLLLYIASEVNIFHIRSYFKNVRIGAVVRVCKNVMTIFSVQHRTTTSLSPWREGTFSFTVIYLMLQQVKMSKSSR